MYKFIQDQIALCDNEIEGVLQIMMAQKQQGIIEKIPDPSHATTAESRKNKNQPAFNVREYLKEFSAPMYSDLWDKFNGCPGGIR
ncbi:hypothetical protein LZD49_34240 [Dyadobacter sp. CY261]|uniref:hypothetical protein n=1 Tax=Dyadobacter sp. CY261 TaxID=2907203 RepID=UPI001F2C469A|nr:hypothetical protein [Dyadobacter sp. CY261]MCF0075584.1 hypothetical protein [Dyadobacter sp. CY261]